MTKNNTLEIAELAITLNKSDFIVTNQRALFWKTKETLILSDLHIGKTGHFRKHGIPIPDQVMFTDLSRLEGLINYFNPTQILIVGDLFHANANANFKDFKKWIHFYKNIKWILIKGNHDRHSDAFYKDFNLEVYKELVMDTFKFIHQPPEDSNAYLNISGHIHPGVRLRLKGKQFIKLPCFQLNDNQFILAAFSLFTGLNTRKIDENTICYPFTDRTIWEMKK